MPNRKVNRQMSDPIGNNTAPQPYLRPRVACVLRPTGTDCGVWGIQVGPKSLQIKWASDMLGDGYDVEAIISRGRRASPNSHRYIWLLNNRSDAPVIGDGEVPCLLPEMRASFYSAIKYISANSPETLSAPRLFAQRDIRRLALVGPVEFVSILRRVGSRLP